MTSNSAWDMPITVATANLPDGQYNVELTDIVLRAKVVTWNEAYRSQDKSVNNKEYDSQLTDAQKAQVDAAPQEFWDKEKKRPKNKTEDRVAFSFVEPKSGKKLTRGVEFVANSPKLATFITKSTGAQVETGKKISDYFKPGDKFVVTLESDPKTNFQEIEPDSVMRAELAASMPKGADALSANAKAMLDYLKANCQGQRKNVVADLYGSGKFGTTQEASSAWQEIMRAVPYTKDGRTLDFTE